MTPRASKPGLPPTPSITRRRWPWRSIASSRIPRCVRRLASHEPRDEPQRATGADHMPEYREPGLGRLQRWTARRRTPSLRAGARARRPTKIRARDRLPCERPVHRRDQHALPVARAVRPGCAWGCDAGPLRRAAHAAAWAPGMTAARFAHAKRASVPTRVAPGAGGAAPPPTRPAPTAAVRCPPCHPSSERPAPEPDHRSARLRGSAPVRRPRSTSPTLPTVNGDHPLSACPAPPR